MTEPKREALKARIEAAQESEAARRAKKFGQRVEDNALEAKDKFTEFAKEHPIATIAGGVALGILIASMFKAPRQAAVRTGTKAAGLASMGGEMALAYAAQLLASANEAGREGLRQMDDLSDTMSDAARKARREATYLVGNASDAARISSRKAGKTVSRALKRP